MQASDNTQGHPTSSLVSEGNGEIIAVGSRLVPDYLLILFTTVNMMRLGLVSLTHHCINQVKFVKKA